MILKRRSKPIMGVGAKANRVIFDAIKWERRIMLTLGAMVVLGLAGLAVWAILLFR